MRGRFDIGADPDATGWHGVLVNDGADVQLWERCVWDAAHVRAPQLAGDECLARVSAVVWPVIAPDVLVALGGSRRRRRVTRLAPMGNTTSYSHDAAGRLRAQVDAEGHHTQYGYAPSTGWCQ